MDLELSRTVGVGFYTQIGVAQPVGDGLAIESHLGDVEADLMDPEVLLPGVNGQSPERLPLIDSLSMSIARSKWRCWRSQFRSGARLSGSPGWAATAEEEVGEALAIRIRLE